MEGRGWERKRAGVAWTGVVKAARGRAASGGVAGQPVSPPDTIKGELCKAHLPGELTRVLLTVGLPQLLSHKGHRVQCPEKVCRWPCAHSGKNPVGRIPQGWPQRSRHPPGKGRILSTPEWPLSGLLEEPPMRGYDLETHLSFLCHP